jgi:hypothetical protein
LEPHSVALDETAREVSERQVLPAGGLRERFDRQRPRTVPRARLLLFQTTDCSRAAGLRRTSCSERVLDHMDGRALASGWGVRVGTRA